MEARSEPHSSTTSTAASKLRATIAAFPGQPFAVVDGGQFEDLPSFFKRERLFARSLFLDQADSEVQNAGPWLVALNQAPQAPDRMSAVIGDKPAAVYWCCCGGDAVLYRHLRSLNMTRIPPWAAAGKDAPEASDQLAASEIVFFRHFDPRVLGALLPCLDAAQFARLLGPAEELAFVSDDFGGLKRVIRDPTWPSAPSGLLTIRSEQMSALSERRMEASRRRIASYLNDAAQDKTSHLSDSDLREHVLRSESSGQTFGLSTERAQAKWAYLMLMTDGGVESSPGVREFLQAPNKNPNRQMDIFMQSLVAARARLGDP